MATILLARELGGGLGHLMRLDPLAEGLAARGHRIIAVLRELSSARGFFSDSGVACLQAPLKQQHAGNIDPTCTFAQILHNCGFGNARSLAALADAWGHICTRPSRPI